MAAFSLSVNDVDATPTLPPLAEAVDPPSVLPRTDGSLVAANYGRGLGGWDIGHLCCTRNPSRSLVLLGWDSRGVGIRLGRSGAAVVSLALLSTPDVSRPAQGWFPSTAFSTTPFSRPFTSPNAIPYSTSAPLRRFPMLPPACPLPSAPTPSRAEIPGSFRPGSWSSVPARGCLTRNYTCPAPGAPIPTQTNDKSYFVPRGIFGTIPRALPHRLLANQGSFLLRLRGGTSSLLDTNNVETKIAAVGIREKALGFPAPQAPNTFLAPNITLETLSRLLGFCTLATQQATRVRRGAYEDNGGLSTYHTIRVKRCSPPALRTCAARRCASSRAGSMARRALCGR